MPKLDELNNQHYATCHICQALANLRKMTNCASIESIDKIVQSDFLPNAEQIVNCRYRTSGMREEKLIIDNQHFSIFDVGGQRNERRKWIKLFDGVHALIFMVALSEFDQHLRESTFYENRMFLLYRTDVAAGRINGNAGVFFRG